jgi:phage N-6-adenine-methyltransferase
MGIFDGEPVPGDWVCEWLEEEEEEEPRHIFLQPAVTCEWSTPFSLFYNLDAEFGGFTLDAAASHLNHKCANYYTVEDDALTKPWPGRIWLNPPYGAVLNKWIPKAFQESCTNAEVVVCLVPARTDTVWWAEVVVPFAREIRFIARRVRFLDESGQPGGASPFAACLIVFAGKDAGPPLISACTTEGLPLK